MTNAEVETAFHTLPGEYSVPTMAPPTVTMHPMELSPLEQARSFIIGYRDCATEAIRFLIEEENVPVTDPLIVGLVNRLIEQERALAMHEVLYGQNSLMVVASQNCHIDVQHDLTQDHSGIVSQAGSQIETHSQNDDLHSNFNDSGLHEPPRVDLYSTDSHSVSQISNNSFSQTDAKIASLAGEILALLEEESMSDFHDDGSDTDEGFDDIETEHWV